MVEAIGRELRTRGLSVFLDRWYLVPGRPWPDHLEKVLSTCRAVAIFLGPSGMGRWQQREQYVALDRQALNPSFPVVPVLLPGADPPLGFLSLNTWIDLREGVSDPRSLASLAAALQGEPPGSIIKQQIAATLASICPYRGLRFFREEDATFFFGRDAFIQRLLGEVDQHQLVAVIGPSGSGKSSVVRAGLIPKLRESSGKTVWDIVTMVPGDRPLQSLAAALVPLLEPDMTEIDRLKEVGKLAEYLMTGQIRLQDVVSRALEKQPGTNRLMIFIDQWEELYTLTRDEQVRQTFLDQILETTKQGPFSAVLTLRGDYFDQILACRPLSDRLQGAIVNISRMTREELKQVIERPALKVGLQFETGLVSRILDKVEGQPGNLPLLEFVLTELWTDRQEELLTHASYEKIGEVQGAIASHAEAVFAKFSTSEQEIARRIFLHLIRPELEVEQPSNQTDLEYTRRRTSFTELGIDSLPVVRNLADAHLVVTGRSEATGEEVIDLVHEALINGWGRLQKWIQNDRKFLIWREQLRTLISIWAANNNDESTLLRGKLLAEAREWLQHHETDLGAMEEAYIKRSLEASDREIRLTRNKKIFITGVLSLLLFFIIIWLWLYSWNNQGNATSTTNSNSRTDNNNARAGEELPEEEAMSQPGLNGAVIRSLVGVTSIEMVHTRLIAVIGPPPPKGILSEEQVLTNSSNSQPDNLLSNHISLTVQSVKIVAPRVQFVFLPVESTSTNSGAVNPNDLASALKRVLNVVPKPNVLIVPYGPLREDHISAILQNIISHDITIVLPAGNDPDSAIPFANSPLADSIIIVSGVNLQGQRSDFAPSGNKVFWAPAEDIPFRLPNGNKYVSRKGTTTASGIAAGIAVRVLDQYPELKPAQLIQVLRSTSKPGVAGGEKILNLNASLARLSNDR